MEKYILQILESSSRIIVPEFGAFIIKQKNPLVIVFNEFLQYNDGVLIDTIDKSEGTDRDTAKKHIDNFVKEINSQLDKGNPYVIEQLGTLVKSSTGKISLEKDTAGKTSKTADIKKDVKKSVQTTSEAKTAKEQVKDDKKVDESKKKTTEPKKEIKKEAEKIEEKVEDKNKKVAKPPIEKLKEEKQEKKEVQEPAAKESKTSIRAESSVKKDKPEPQVQATIPKKTPLTKAASSTTNDPKTRRTNYYTPRTATPSKEPKKKTNIWLWVIIILIVNGIIITYFVLSDQLSGLFKKTEQVSTPDYHDMTSESEEEQQEEMIIVEPEEQLSEEEPVIEQPKPQPALTGKRYYVVAGVFREEQNADNLVMELRNRGYNSEKFGKIGSLHAVSFGVYTSKSEAEKELLRIKQEVNPEAWIKVTQ